MPLAGMSDRLPGVGRLPADVRPVVMGIIDILLLAVAFLVIRRLVVLAVRRGVERVALREENHGNHGRASRLRTLSGLTTSILIYIVGFTSLSRRFRLSASTSQDHRHGRGRRACVRLRRAKMVKDHDHRLSSFLKTSTPSAIT